MSNDQSNNPYTGKRTEGKLWHSMHFFIGKGGKKAHMALVFPPGKCYAQVAIQMQWSKQVYISQNNKEGANTCSISQQPAWLQLRGLLSLGIFLGNILKTQKPFGAIGLLCSLLSSTACNGVEEAIWKQVVNVIMGMLRCVKKEACINTGYMHICIKCITSTILYWNHNAVTVRIFANSLNI